MVRSGFVDLHMLTTFEVYVVMFHVEHALFQMKNYKVCFRMHYISSGCYVWTADYKYSEDRVVVDGKLITSRGPGTCIEFALAIVEQIQGKEKAQSLIKPMLIKV